MHEISIAESLLRVATAHVPAGSVLRSVHVRVGPLQGIDAAALDLAWRGVVGDAGPRLRVSFLHWRMRCPRCGRAWTSPDLAHRCACGCQQAYPLGGSELELESLQVDDAVPEGAVPCESQWSRKF